MYNLFKETISRLEPIYGVGEANSIARRLFEDGHGITRKDLILNRTMKLSEQTIVAIRSQIKLLESEHPVQYIVGFEEFLSRRFVVTPDVLIPRQETEELVRHIIQNWRAEHTTILDIGTGSGAIAISLVKELHDVEVTAWDISREALKIAQLNADRNSASIVFEEVDILNTDNCDKCWDVIVSNPPYVLDSERALIRRNVIDHEPHTALFVTDNDPLIFYRTIAQFAVNHLHPQGRLYFEINRLFAAQTVRMLAEYGFENIIVQKDLHGADRIVYCNAK